jgi:hypothetical protein
MLCAAKRVCSASLSRPRVEVLSRSAFCPISVRNSPTANTNPGTTRRLVPVRWRRHPFDELEGHGYAECDCVGEDDSMGSPASTERVAT